MNRSFKLKCRLGQPGMKVKTVAWTVPSLSQEFFPLPHSCQCAKRIQKAGS